MRIDRGFESRQGVDFRKYKMMKWKRWWRWIDMHDQLNQATHT
jgi:hypothetical protein